MNHIEVRVQRAIRAMEISSHPLFVKEPVGPDEPPGAYTVMIPTQPHLPRNRQGAPLPVRDGTIWMRSRNVPGRKVRGGMMLKLDLLRAAAVLAEDTYEIATLDHIAIQVQRDIEYRAYIQKRDDDIKSQNLNVRVENPSTTNVTMAAPAWLENMMSAQLPKTEAAVYAPPAGYKLVPIDEVPAKRTRRKKSTVTETVADSPQS